MSLLLLLLRLAVTNVVVAVVVQRRRGGCFLSELVMTEGALYGYFAKIWELHPSSRCSFAELVDAAYSQMPSCRFAY